MQNPDYSSQSKALSDSAPSTGFSEQSSVASHQRAYEFFPPNDNGYGRTVTGIPGSGVPVNTHFDTIDPSYPPQDSGVSGQQIQSKHGTHYDFNSLFTHDPKQGAAQGDYNLPSEWSDDPSCASESPLQELVYRSNIREAASTLLTQSYQGSADWPLYLAPHNVPNSKFNLYLQSESPATILGHDVTRGLPRTQEDWLWEGAHQQEKELSEDVLHRNVREPEFRNWASHEESPSADSQHQNPTLLHTEKESPAVDACLDNQYPFRSYFPEEETFDKSDDEMGLDDHDEDVQSGVGKIQYDHLKNNDLGIIVALQASQDRQEQRPRTYHSFLDRPNVLTTYQPSAQTSPLNDSTAARIFHHFVNVTGPSISVYERHPANPSLLFQGHPVPKSQQHIWACKYILKYSSIYANLLLKIQCPHLP